ncbi:hypothetical protein THAOC_28359, partial [Thalassiosira oceanica]
MASLSTRETYGVTQVTCPLVDDAWCNFKKSNISQSLDSIFCVQVKIWLFLIEQDCGTFIPGRSILVLLAGIKAYLRWRKRSKSRLNSVLGAQVDIRLFVYEQDYDTIHPGHQGIMDLARPKPTTEPTEILCLRYKPFRSDLRFFYPGFRLRLPEVDDADDVAREAGRDPRLLGVPRHLEYVPLAPEAPDVLPVGDAPYIELAGEGAGREVVPRRGEGDGVDRLPVPGEDPEA